MIRESPREIVEVQHVAEVAEVIANARELVRQFLKGGFIGEECKTLHESLLKLDTRRAADERERNKANGKAS